MYFDDLPVGFEFETDETELTEEAIVAFARQWDPQSFHLDAEAAQSSPYGGLIASGFHTLLTAFLQTLQADVWKEASMGSPGMDEIRWLRPVRPGTRLRTRARVETATPSRSRPDRGRTTIAHEVLDQTGEVVMRFKTHHILARRTP